MRPEDKISSNEKKPRKRRMNLELYYWEQVGNRSYFRYTPFALILTIAAGLFVIAMLFIFVIFDSKEPQKPDIKITVPSPSPSSSYSLLQPAPSTTPPARANRPPQFTTLTPSSPPTQNKNAKELLAPQQTSSAQPATPPP